MLDNRLNRIRYFLLIYVFRSENFIYNERVKDGFRLERRENMPVQRRIMLSLLIEKMKDHKEYCEKLGIENCSRFHGKKITKEEKKE